MTWVRLMAVCLALFWVPLSSHCRIESLTGSELLACAGESACRASAACGEAPVADDHCAGDACATVESGHYKTELRSVEPVPPAPIFMLACWLSAQTAVPVESMGTSSPPGQPPPELAVGWTFVSRTALPPRAPSFAS